MLKYEQEIRYIIKAKDQHYDEMMTAKDAKIMNLIEGTDFQALLIKHEMELEQLRPNMRAASKDFLDFWICWKFWEIRSISGGWPNRSSYFWLRNPIGTLINPTFSGSFLGRSRTLLHFSPNAFPQ